MSKLLDNISNPEMNRDNNIIHTVFFLKSYNLSLNFTNTFLYLFA